MYICIRTYISLYTYIIYTYIYRNTYIYIYIYICDFPMTYMFHVDCVCVVPGHRSQCRISAAPARRPITAFAKPLCFRRPWALFTSQVSPLQPGECAGARHAFAKPPPPLLSVAGPLCTYASTCRETRPPEPIRCLQFSSAGSISQSVRTHGFTRSHSLPSLLRRGRALARQHSLQTTHSHTHGDLSMCLFVPHNAHFPKDNAVYGSTRSSTTMSF